MVSSKVAVSSTSACASKKFAVSHVLAAIAGSVEEANWGIRAGLGRFTSTEDIQVTLEVFERAVSRFV